MDVKEAKEILSDMRDQHLQFIDGAENTGTWGEKFLKEAWACDSGAKALAGLITGIKINKGVIAESILRYGRNNQTRFAWKNAQSLSKQSVRQSVEKSTVIT